MAAPFESCGPTGQRILQIHPTLRCNLQCEHCYSSSGPWSREELDLDVVNNVVSDAARMGYGVLSVSGGEPFLYPGPDFGANNIPMPTPTPSPNRKLESPFLSIAASNSCGASRKGKSRHGQLNFSILRHE